MTSSHLSPLRSQMMVVLDSALREHVAKLRISEDGLWQMAAQAMGWQTDHAEASGKRIRPLLCLLVAGATPADWQAALPAACAVELIHSFSLVHDDIQDASHFRRGYPTVWKTFGSAQAINAGDALFTLAFSALADAPSTMVSRLLKITSAACIRLTQGQFLDMAFELAHQTSLTQYQEMIDGKTAALIETACRLGAASANAATDREEAFARFGRSLGLAFQAHDDYLGIWGDPAETGKSTASDLLSRKKSLPILFGLQQSSEFQSLLAAEPVEPHLPALLRELEACGAREHTLEQARSWTEEAFTALHAATPAGECGAALEELARSLLNRSR
jgi:geranylgeranyl diphosphate synthase, type I